MLKAVLAMRHQVSEEELRALLLSETRTRPVAGTMQRL